MTAPHHILENGLVTLESVDARSVGLLITWSLDLVTLVTYQRVPIKY
jgi:hypothetical protein